MYLLVENTANFHEGRGRRTGNDPLSSHEMTLSGKYLWFCTFQAPIPDGFRENQLGKSAELVFQAPIPGSLSSPSVLLIPVSPPAMADIDLSTLNYMKLKRHLISMGIPKAEVPIPLMTHIIE